MTDNLPPLPGHPEHGWVWTEAEQRAIRAYAAQAVAAERERCAKLCDELHAEMLDQGVAGAYGDAFARRIRGA